jgi:hypothetical protein
MANTYLDEASPADSDPITLGAGAIRTFKQEMDLLIDQVWATTGLFNAGWITAPGANITGGGSMFAPGAIQTADIAPTAVTTALLGANAVGPGQINPTAITTALLAAASAATQLTVPTASVNTAAIQNGAVGTSQIAAQAVTAALLATGFARIAIGQYPGTASGSTVISGLGFNPTVVIIVDAAYHGVGLAFAYEAGSPGASVQIHDSWDADSTLITNAHQNFIQFGTGQFTVVTPATHFNYNLHTYTYLALGTT